MFFVSNIYDGKVTSNKIGITDTDDNKEDIWSNRDLVRIKEYKNLWS